MGVTESQARKRQALAGIGLGLLCWLLLSGAYLAGLFETFDHRLLDLRFRLRGERVAAEKIVIVGIDDATVRGYGAWPLPRDSYALLFTALSEAGARAIGVDLQFPSDRNQDSVSNALLAHVSATNENLVHSIWFYSDAGSRRASTLSPAARETLDRHGAVETAHAAEAAGAAVPFDDLATSARRFGHITVAVDRDGTIRRVPLFVRHADRIYPALAVALYGVEQGTVGGPSIQSVGRGIRAHWPGGARIFAPVDRQGMTAIDFAGDAAAFPFAHSMLRVLQWYQDGDSARLREAFAGKTVLVGLTSREEVSEDVAPTPFAAATPLLYVHANLLENLHRGRFLSRLPNVVYLGALAVYAAGIGFLFSVAALPVAAALIALATVLLPAISQAALSWAGLDIPPVLCLALGPAVYALTESYRYLALEGRVRKREADIREGLSVQQQFLPEAMIGRQLSHYRIDEKLGAGGMGVVYRGADLRSDRPVAIKVISGGLLADERARRRFRREALALSRLSHPNIAQLIDSDREDGTEFIVMEYIAGKSLAHAIAGKPLPVSRAIEIADQVCDALGEAHRHGILHRDLKPGNVMLTDRGAVKLLDFGLARFIDIGTSEATVTADLTKPGNLVGTLPYMAPEALQGTGVDERTDIYGVGVLLFEMLTGRRPYYDDQPHELMYTILHQPPPRPMLLNGLIPPHVEEVILACLAKHPAGRPAQASAVRRALGGVSG